MVPSPLGYNYWMHRVGVGWNIQNTVLSNGNTATLEHQEDTQAPCVTPAGSYRDQSNCNKLILHFFMPFLPDQDWLKNIYFKLPQWHIILVNYMSAKATYKSLKESIPLSDNKQFNPMEKPCKCKQCWLCVAGANSGTNTDTVIKLMMLWHTIVTYGLKVCLFATSINLNSKHIE